VICEEDDTPSEMCNVWWRIFFLKVHCMAEKCFEGHQEAILDALNRPMAVKFREVS